MNHIPVSIQKGGIRNLKKGYISTHISLLDIYMKKVKLKVIKDSYKKNNKATLNLYMS